MTETRKTSSTRNSRLIHASPETLYRAFTDAKALEQWLAPGEMYGKVHNFDLRTGGGYTMSLYYPSSEREARGKTAEHEDRFTARFVELAPGKIVQAINFESDDPGFRGEMTMQVTFVPKGNGTEVTFLFTGIPPGIRPEDNEAGTELTLKKLARFTEDKRGYI